MNTSDLKREVRLWAKRIKRREAIALLVKNKISASVAVKLVRGAYPSEPGPLLEDAIKKAMGLQDDIAS